MEESCGKSKEKRGEKLIGKTPPPAEVALKVAASPYPNFGLPRSHIFEEMASMLRVLLIMLVASYTDALLVGTRSAMVPKVQLRAQEAPPPPPTGKLGATVDQDGKSNVWV